MPTIQQLVSENRDNSIIAQELLKKTPVEAITICISIILALIKSLEKKDDKITMFKFVIDLLTKGYNKKIITTKCATCEVEVPVIEEMKDEVNLCPKCGGY